MTPEALRDVLAAELAAAGAPASSEHLDQLVRYLHLLARWRTRARLTAIADPRAAARLHIADALLCLRADLPAGASLLDVGSGAGLPGIPLLIARPDLRVTLLEAESRKAAFLEIAAQELELALRVVCARAEEAGHDPGLREQFGIVAARAVAPLPVLSELTLPFARAGGMCVLLKGPSVHAELRRAAAASRIVGGGKPQTIEAILAGGERRVVVVIRKERPTPAEFPRRPGVPRRRPLPIKG